MLLVGVTLIVAVVVGLLRGGSLHQLSQTPLRSGWLAVGAAGVQLASGLIGGPPTVGVLLTLVSQALLLAFLWRNRLLPGAVLVAIGSTCNAAVIAANGAMPVSREAILKVARHPLELTGGRHRILEPGDALPWLADIIGLPALRTVVSVGDVVMAAGVGLIMVHLLQPPRRRPPSERSAAEPGDGVREPLT